MFIGLWPPSSQAPAGRHGLKGTVGHYAPLGLGTIAGTVRSINIVPLRGWAPAADVLAGRTNPEMRVRSREDGRTPQPGGNTTGRGRRASVVECGVERRFVGRGDLPVSSG